MNRLLSQAMRGLTVLALLTSALGLQPVASVRAAPITVTTEVDNVPGSLREAIASAVSGDTIDFDPALNGKTITLTAGEMLIDKNLTISGPGASLLAVSGASLSRVFSVAVTATVSLSGLTIQNGAATGGVGGAIANDGDLTIADSTLLGSSAQYGGAIANNGSLTILRSAVISNTAANDGGGITSSGVLLVRNTTIADNTANLGGGLVNLGALTLEASTFSGNSAGTGGGVNNGPSATANLTNVLLIKGASGLNCRNQNAAANSLTGNNNMADDASCNTIGIQKTAVEINPGSLTGNPAYRPVLAGSAAIDAGTATCASPDQHGVARPQGPACDIGAYEHVPAVLAELGLVKSVTPASAVPGQTITYTLSFSNTGNLTATGVVITDTLPVSITSPSFTSSGVTITRRMGTTYVWDVQNLAPSASGLITVTGVLTPTGLTVGQIITNTATLGTTTAETGTVNNSSSVGLTVTCPPVITVTTTADSGPGSLRQALVEVCAGGAINFSLTTPATITLTSGQLALTRSVTINGLGAALLAVSGNNAARVFNVAGGVQATLSGLTIRQGNTPGTACPGACGAGIYNAGALTVTSSIVSNNTAGFYSGGLHNQSGGVLTITNSSIISNTAGGGAGLANFSTVALQNSMVASNTATFPGSFGSGGGFVNALGATAATLTNVTVTGNRADGTLDDGGGGGLIISAGTVTLLNSTVTNNSTANLGASGKGAGGIVHAGGTITLRNTIVASNTSAAGRPDVSGSFTSLGNNLIGSTFGSTGFTQGVNGDIAGTNAAPVNAYVGALGNYGGSTQTRALLPGSPAINTANPAFCPAQDQRGVSRIGTCDIGAYESRGFTLIKGGGDQQSAVVNQFFLAPLIVNVTSAFSEPVIGGAVTFAGPVVGQSTNPVSGQATIAGGAASLAAKANGTVGTYSVSASANGGSPNVTFTLTNTAVPVYRVYLPLIRR